MKRLFLAAVVVSLLVTMALTSWGASTVSSSKSNQMERLKGNFVTATTTVSGLVCSELYTIPASAKLFLLAQFCTGPDAILLESIGIGNIAQTGGGQTCITFDTGVYLPPGSALGCCGMTDAEGWCMITGLQN
jgi:hypothetical protein